MGERYILHVDMDAFFAAVEQRDDPSLRGKPVIVGADPKGGRGRGVVSTCSYEARKFGVRSAMPISEAWRRCPQGVFVTPDFHKYSAASEIIHRIFYDFTPDIEPISIDEAFLDITNSYKLFGSPLDVARLIKERIKAETGLTASVGLAPTKMAAKIASDLQKPDGLVEVKAGEIREFLKPLDIGRIWGLGPKTANVMREHGIHTIGQLAQATAPELCRLFGRHGPEFRELALGHDDREVLMEGEAKSVSNEYTFEADTADEREISEALLALCDKVSSRLRADGFKGRTITLKIRLEGFVTFTRAATMAFATNYTDVIHWRIRELYEAFNACAGAVTRHPSTSLRTVSLSNRGVAGTVSLRSTQTAKRGDKKVRLLGVKVSGLIPAGVRESLFEEEQDKKLEGVHKAVEAIRGKFGRGAIYRAGGKKDV